MTGLHEDFTYKPSSRCSIHIGEHAARLGQNANGMRTSLHIAGILRALLFVGLAELVRSLGPERRFARDGNNAT